MRGSRRIGMVASAAVAVAGLLATPATAQPGGRGGWGGGQDVFEPRNTLPGEFLTLPAPGVERGHGLVRHRGERPFAHLRKSLPRTYSMVR